MSPALAGRFFTTSAISDLQVGKSHAPLSSPTGLLGGPGLRHSLNQTQAFRRDVPITWNVLFTLFTLQNLSYTWVQA